MREFFEAYLKAKEEERNKFDDSVNKAVDSIAKNLGLKEDENEGN